MAFLLTMPSIPEFIWAAAAGAHADEGLDLTITLINNTVK
jgi:hypothetical protein